MAGVQVSGAFTKKMATSGEFSAKHFSPEGILVREEYQNVNSAFILLVEVWGVSWQWNWHESTRDKRKLADSEPAKASISWKIQSPSLESAPRQCNARWENRIKAKTSKTCNRPLQCLRTSCCEAISLRHTETETMIIVGVYFWCLTCTMNVHAIVCKGDIFPMKKYEKPRQPVPQKQSIAYLLLLQADANCIQLPQDIEVARELQTFNQVKVCRSSAPHTRMPALLWTNASLVLCALSITQCISPFWGERNAGANIQEPAAKFSPWFEVWTVRVCWEPPSWHVVTTCDHYSFQGAL